METELFDDERSASEARAADVRQAVYFSRWLHDELVEVESRITSRRLALAEHEARGEVAAARQLHRGNSSDELERTQLRYMLIALHRRFSPAWIPLLPGWDTSPPRHDEPNDLRAEGQHAADHTQLRHAGGRDGHSRAQQQRWGCG